MNLDAMRRDLATKRDAAAARFAAVAQAANADGNRALTAEEKADVKALTDDALALKARIDAAEADAAMGRTIEGIVDGTSAVLVPARPANGAPQPRIAASMGEQFVRSHAGDFLKAGLHRTTASWRTPSVELFDPRGGMYGATLSEDPASGGKLVVPDVRPALLSLLFRRLVVADLMASGTTESNLITYMVEKTYVNAADTVLEGAAKPESTLTFDAVSDPVRKIAHWLPVTEEMLEDVSQIKSYIDARLRLGIQLAEEDQLLNGSLVAPDIVGLRNRPGLAPDVVVGAAPDTGQDAIFRQMMAIYSTSFLMPDGIVINPANWQHIQLTKTSTGEYVGGGPFTAPAPPMLWGLPVAVTPAMTVGTALVGAYGSASQVFRKGGVRVEASNSHQDFFIKNLVAIRAEERLALAVYRPGAFGEVTSLL